MMLGSGGPLQVACLIAQLRPQDLVSVVTNYCFVYLSLDLDKISVS